MNGPGFLILGCLQLQNFQIENSIKDSSYSKVVLSFLNILLVCMVALYKVAPYKIRVLVVYWKTTIILHQLQDHHHIANQTDHGQYKNLC